MKRNRLKLMKIYLIGPMCRARESGKIWREELTPWLENRGMIVLNPYQKPLLDKIGLENDDEYKNILAYKNIRDWNGLAHTMKPIRNVDLRMSDEASCLFVYLDLDGQPCGSYEEIFNVNRQKKPVILVCPQGLENVPNWLWAVLPIEFFFDNIESAKEYLRHIDEDEHIDNLGRWHFFDLEQDYRRILDL